MPGSQVRAIGSDNSQLDQLRKRPFFKFVHGYIFLMESPGGSWRINDVMGLYSVIQLAIYLECSIYDINVFLL